MFIFDYQMFEHQLINLVKNVSFMKSNDIKNMQILKLNNIIYDIIYIYLSSYQRWKFQQILLFSLFIDQINKDIILNISIVSKRILIFQSYSSRWW